MLSSSVGCCCVAPADAVPDESPTDADAVEVWPKPRPASFPGAGCCCWVRLAAPVCWTSFGFHLRPSRRPRRCLKPPITSMRVKTSRRRVKMAQRWLRTARVCCVSPRAYFQGRGDKLNIFEHSSLKKNSDSSGNHHNLMLYQWKAGNAVADDVIPGSARNDHGQSTLLQS